MLRGLNLAWTPRALPGAARMTAAFLLVGGISVAVENALMPAHAFRGGEAWIAYVASAIFVALAIAMAKIPERLPAAIWPFLLVGGVVGVVLLSVGSHDPSAASQIAFMLPLLVAAYHFRLQATVVVLVSAIAGECVVCFRLLAFSAALENVIGVSILLIAVTFMLAGARKTIEKGFDLLRYQADHDPLTGLANRRVFDLDFLDVSDDAAGSRSLLLIDIDDFKAVNDTFGHGAGDALLNDLAACLRAVCRPADRIYRIGGDELAVLLVNCPPSVALARAETVRRAVEEMRSDADPRHELRTTVSIGFASAPLHGRRAIDLMRSADRALYEAKDAGRNLVRAGRPVALGLAMEG